MDVVVDGRLRFVMAKLLLLVEPDQFTRRIADCQHRSDYSSGIDRTIFRS